MSIGVNCGNDGGKETEMSGRLKPKVPLDSEMIQLINEYYSVKLNESCMLNDCFSHPDLESHICNVKTPVDGGKECQYCCNIPGRYCSITCHIHHFCLAVFAYRLGIGGDDLKKAIKYNTRKLSYLGLSEAVGKAIKNLDNDSTYEGNLAQDLSRLELENQEKIGKEEELKMSTSKKSTEKKPAEKPAEKKSTEKKPAEKKSTEKKPAEKKAKVEKKSEKKSEKKVKVDKKSEANLVSADGQELLTIRKAAKVYGCSYYNMYTHVKRGSIQPIDQNGNKYLVMNDVLELRKKLRGE